MYATTCSVGSNTRVQPGGTRACLSVLHAHILMLLVRRVCQACHQRPGGAAANSSWLLCPKKRARSPRLPTHDRLPPAKAHASGSCREWHRDGAPPLAVTHRCSSHRCSSSMKTLPVGDATHTNTPHARTRMHAPHTHALWSGHSSVSPLTQNSSLHRSELPPSLGSSNSTRLTCGGSEE
jgi:hypothetical protein